MGITSVNIQTNTKFNLIYKSGFKSLTPTCLKPMLGEILIMDFFFKDTELLFRNGYKLVDYSNYNFTKGERVYVYIQAMNYIGQNVYGYIEAIAKSSGKNIEFESKNEYFDGCSWVRTIYRARNNKVIVTKEFVEEENDTRDVYNQEQKRELDEWYDNLSYGNRKAVRKILGLGD